MFLGDVIEVGEYVVGSFVGWHGVTQYPVTVHILIEIITGCN
jgi:hypothetical protein